jgi:prepilin-type N-terminal cleavage/methylation domain-containing protein
MNAARRLRRDDGVTLVEILVAVSILGIALVTLMGGLWTAIVSSDQHRKEASAGVALRTYAEAVQNASYTGCATTSTYAPAAVGFTTPGGYTASVTTAEYWHPSGTDPNTGTFDTTCSTDQGLERLTLSVASSDSRATETIQVLKRKP